MKMEADHVTARAVPAGPASGSIGLRLREEAPCRATAIATENAHLLLDYYFVQGGRTILLHFDGVVRWSRISGTLWSPEGRLWLLDLEQPAA